MSCTKNTPHNPENELAKAEAIWDVVVREAAERKLGEAGPEPADVLRLLEAHEKELLYEVETLANEFFRDFTVQAWRTAGEALRNGISRGKPHWDAYLDAMKSFFMEYAASVMRLYEEWQRSPDRGGDFWKLEVRGRQSWTWAADLRRESEPRRVELEERFGTTDERARKIGAAHERISARSGLEPLCVAHCLHGVTVILMPYIMIKLIELGGEKVKKEW